MRHHTFTSRAHDLTHSELIALARENAGEGDWEVYSVNWYDSGSTTTFATVELVAPDRQPQVET